MAVLDGDIVRMVQFATLDDGQRVSSKYYFRATMSEPIPDATVVTAAEAWIEAAYWYLRTWVTAGCELSEAVLDRIAWIDGAWRTMANLGTAMPDDYFSPVQTPPPNQIAGVLTFTTAIPRTRRPFYQWGPRMDGVTGGYFTPLMLQGLAAFGVQIITPILFSASSYLVPCIAHATRDGVEVFAGLEMADDVTALQRRRPG